MFCHNCGAKIEDLSKFCHGCGKQTISTPVAVAQNVESNRVVVSMANSEATIKCGNCAYEGPGKKARSVVAQVLAWLCVLFAPLITIIYFVATHKYRCPKCESTFLGVKNKYGVFVGQTGSRWWIIIVCVFVCIAVVGLLSTLAVVALGSARVKARDSKRLADLKQVQTALELYYTDQNLYPTGSEAVLGTERYACLNAKGWQPANCFDPYMGVIPTDPSDGEYIYSSNIVTYEVTATLEGETNGLKGQIKLTPAGIEER